MWGAARVDYARGVITRKSTEDEGWLDDPVTQLRIRGEPSVFALPVVAPGTQLLVGAAEHCDLVLRDLQGRVSRLHAALIRGPHGWSLQDRESSNGVWQDGERRMAIELTPGMELTLGSLTLVVESERLVTLRAYLSRVLGWEPSRELDVEHGIQAARAMATRRAGLVLCGDGDLSEVARRLHQLTLGEARPFVICERGAALPDGAATLCFVDDALPDDFTAVVERLTAAGARARLIVCSPSRLDATDVMTQLGRAAMLELPALATREHDLERLIVSYAEDAARALGASWHGFREHEMVWLSRVKLSSLWEIEDLARRVVALRIWGVKGGAERLGITHVALSRWAKRRGIPT